MSRSQPVNGPTEKQLNDYRLSVLQKITDMGHVVQGVFGTDPDNTGYVQAFCYTVGLTERPWPELFLDRLSPKQGQPILNAVAHALTEPPVDGQMVDAEYSVPFRIHGPIDLDEAEINMARSLYGRDAVTAMQVLWPDTNGRYPGDDGYDAAAYPQRLITKKED